MPIKRLNGKVTPNAAPIDKAGFASGIAIRMAAGAAMGVQLESGVDPLDPTIRADGVDVGEAIRSEDVTAAVSLVAAVPQVRVQLVAMQRASIAGNTDRIVVEGRDIGSTVAPDADFKFYLVADPAARAARRAAEVGLTDTTATMAQTQP